MSIEDVTPPRVFKFWFDASDLSVETRITGIVTRFLSATIHDDRLDVWAETIPSCITSVVRCLLVPTGDKVPDGYQYVSTTETESDLVYHIYARSEIIK